MSSCISIDRLDFLIVLLSLFPWREYVHPPGGPGYTYIYCLCRRALVKDAGMGAGSWPF